MKSLALFFLVLSVVFITMGYMESKMMSQEKEKTIEYRFIPRAFLEEQNNPVNIKDSLTNIFQKEDPWAYNNLV
jgi:hypothetical protein